MTRLNYTRARQHHAIQVGGATHTDDAARRVVYLRVPFEVKGVAKSLGARWDAQAKRWFCLAGTAAASALLARFRMASQEKRKQPTQPSRDVQTAPAAFAASLSEWLSASFSEDRASGTALA